MFGSQPASARLLLAGVMLASSLPVVAQQTTPPAGSAPADAATEAPKLCSHGVCADGFASLSYNYNTNAPQSRLNQLRVFDFNENEPQLDVAQLVIQRAIDKPNQFGFRFNLMAGSGVPEITAASGLFRDRHIGIAHHVDFPEFYVSYIAPVGKGLRIDAGKFATFMGLEAIGGYDGYNDEVSRGYIFGYGTPYTHTGLKATYAFNSKLTALFVVSNGWDDFQRINHGLTYGGQLAITPTKNTSFYLNVISGPERYADDRDERTVGEAVGTWRATPRLTLGFDALYGHEQNAVSIGHDAIWKALAGYAKYNLTPKFSMAFRGEIFADSAGTRTGTPQTLAGFTLTPEYDMAAKPSVVNEHLRRFDGHFVVRGEFRFDVSNKDVFQRQDAYRRQQFTTAVNLIYYF